MFLNLVELPSADEIRVIDDKRKLISLELCVAIKEVEDNFLSVNLLGSLSSGLLFSLSVMESSPLIMEAEECSSSESGWTMYLSSPMHDDGGSDIEVQANDEEEDDANDHNSNENDDGSEGEDNDSMASDASTGPIQHKHGDAKCDQSSLRCHLNHDDDEDGLEEDERKQYYLSYPYKKFCEVNKMRSGRKAGVSHKEDGATSLFHTSSKVKKASGK